VFQAPVFLPYLTSLHLSETSHANNILHEKKILIFISCQLSPFFFLLPDIKRLILRAYGHQSVVLLFLTSDPHSLCSVLLRPKIVLFFLTLPIFRLIVTLPPAIGRLNLAHLLPPVVLLDLTSGHLAGNLKVSPDLEWPQIVAGDHLSLGAEDDGRLRGNCKQGQGILSTSTDTTFECRRCGK
jgi:hypothetical protein